MQEDCSESIVNKEPKMWPLLTNFSFFRIIQLEGDFWLDRDCRKECESKAATLFGFSIDHIRILVIELWLAIEANAYEALF